MISSALKPLTGRIIAVLILLVYSLASPADQNDPALDRLFERLAITTSEEEASNITREIWQRWTANDDPAVSQLMQTGIRALNYSTYRRRCKALIGSSKWRLNLPKGGIKEPPFITTSRSTGDP